MRKELYIKHKKDSEIYHINFKEHHYSKDLRLSSNNLMKSSELFWVFVNGFEDMKLKFPLQLKSLLENNFITQEQYDYIYKSFDNYSIRKLRKENLKVKEIYTF